MRACWLKWVGRDWSISADYIWLNYSDANINYESMGMTSGIAVLQATMEGSTLHTYAN